MKGLNDGEETKLFREMWRETLDPDKCVRRIFCVGRNYAAHAREMGHDPDRDLPFFS